MKRCLFPAIAILAGLILACGCSPSYVYEPRIKLPDDAGVLSGLDVLERCRFAPLRGKGVGVVANHASVNREGRHIVDILSEYDDIDLKAVFVPEHGLYGTEGAGVEWSLKVVDFQGIPVISLYGEKRKPVPDDLRGIDALVFDLQDVGARYYTYASTMTLAMEAAAENGVEMIILDRPNPLGGHEVDGPLRKPEYHSFIGMHAVPIQHGMTLGEMAIMVNESGWLEGGAAAKLMVVPVHGWSREPMSPDQGKDWIPPSPNLPYLECALAYPGTCLLEGTNVSEGRGTDHPFLLVGAPWIDGEALAEALAKLPFTGFFFDAAEFTPASHPWAMRPKYEGRLCRGVRIQPAPDADRRPVLMGVQLLDAIHRLHAREFRFLEDRFIDRLFGSARLREAIVRGEPIEPLIKAWIPEVRAFKAFREPFLIYTGEEQR